MPALCINLLNDMLRPDLPVPRLSKSLGDHRKFKHDKARIFVIIPDADQKDAKPYLEKQVRKAIDESSR